MKTYKQIFSATLTAIIMFSYNGQMIQISDLTGDQISKLFYLKHSQHRLGIFVDRQCMDNSLLAQLYNEVKLDKVLLFKIKLLEYDFNWKFQFSEQ